MDALKIQELPTPSQPDPGRRVRRLAGRRRGRLRHGPLPLRKLRARRFAEIDPEEFYVFTETRPNTLILAPGQRALEWPANEFFSWRNPDGERDLVILQGREPNLNWREYVDIVIDLAERLDVSQVIALGGTYDAVSHRGQVSLSGHATSPELKEPSRVRDHPSSYEGPSSVQSALLEACREQNLLAASLWGHAPHYVRAAPNPKVSHAMLRVLKTLLGVDLDLTELRSPAKRSKRRSTPRCRRTRSCATTSSSSTSSRSPSREPTVEELMADLPLSRPIRPRSCASWKRSCSSAGRRRAREGPPDADAGRQTPDS